MWMYRLKDFTTKTSRKDKTLTNSEIFTPHSISPA
jgi:hypothetical protein